MLGTENVCDPVKPMNVWGVVKLVRNPSILIITAVDPKLKSDAPIVTLYAAFVRRFSVTTSKNTASKTMRTSLKQRLSIYSSPPSLVRHLKQQENSTMRAVVLL